MGFFFRVGLWFARWPSQKVASRISGVVAGCMYALNTHSVQVSRTNVNTCFPDLSDQETEKLVRESLRHMALLFFEFAQLSHWHEDKLLGQIATLTGKDQLDAAYASGKGVLLLVPHFGNWELLCAFLGAHYNFAALYDPPKIPSFEPIILRARQRFKGEMFAIDTGGMRSLLKVIRQGRLVAILPDQVPDRNAGVYADFFGQPALTMTLIHRLTQKNAPVVLMGSVQRKFSEEGLSYDINIEPLHQDVFNEDPVLSATAMNKGVEQVIKRAPEQYQWEYKRFKRPPQKGKNNIYRRQ